MVHQRTTKGRHRRHLIVLGHHDSNTILDAMLMSWLASDIIARVEMRTPPHGQCRRHCPFKIGHAISCDPMRLYGQLRKWKYPLALASTHDHSRTRPDNTNELKLTDYFSFFFGRNSLLCLHFFLRQLTARACMRA